jgi:multicomponent Na+:H+ antiporter subunit D
MSADHALGLAVLLPFLGFIGVLLTGRRPNVREAVTLLSTLLTAAIVFQLFPHAEAGAVAPRLTLFTVMPGVDFAFALEPLGMLYAAVASGLWILTSLYAIGYMRGHDEKNQTRFFACFALSISAALGIAFAANLFTLFLFYEVLTFCTYPLVTHHGTPEAVRAGRVYLGILVTTSVVGLLFAILWTWQISGTTDFAAGGILAGKAEPVILPVLLALYAFGIGKAALMPFHRWLPNAMVAPTPVSALLHAVAVVKAGVFCVLKVVVYVFGLDLLTTTPGTGWLAYVAAFTLLTASAIAIAQDNLKARLAYSTISHLSYIVLGAAIAVPSSVIGGGMHIAMHAAGKITLFFCAGAIYVTAHKTKVSELNGLGRKMPLTMAAFFLASLSLIGLPPFGGMWSKWHLALGAAESGRYVFVFVLMASSLLSVAYLMPPVVRAFFVPADAEHSHQGESDHAPVRDRLGASGGFLAQLQEAPLLCLVPLCLTALGSVGLFFLADELYQLLLPIVGGFQ